MKAVEIISFEDINAIEQPILSLSILKISMKQLALLILTVLIAYSIKIVEISILSTFMLLLITFYKPYNMSFEILLINAIRFIINRDKPVRVKSSKQNNRLYNDMRLFKKREDNGQKIKEPNVPIVNEQLLHYLTNTKDFHLAINDQMIISAGDSKIHLALKDNSKIVLEIRDKAISRIDIL
jgi:predicted DNA-binding protein